MVMIKNETDEPIQMVTIAVKIPLIAKKKFLEFKSKGKVTGSVSTFAGNAFLKEIDKLEKDQG